MPIALPRPHEMCRLTTPRRARRHRIAVGHRHHGHFLQAEDVLKPPIADQGIVERQFGRAGIAENVPHTKTGEEVEKQMNSCHRHGTIVSIQFGRRAFAHRLEDQSPNEPLETSRTAQ